MELIDTCRLDDFFHGLLAEALETERVVIGESSQAYLVQLFSEFSRVEGLHRSTTDRDGAAPTLAWLYERAQTGAPAERFESWRHLGDVALVLAGLFGQHLQRRRSLVGVDYYVRMGSGAYGTAATYVQRSGVAPVLEELAYKFRALVDVLTRIGESLRLPVAGGIERLYERWVATAGGGEDLHARLTRMGAAPVLVGVGRA